MTRDEAVLCMIAETPRTVKEIAASLHEAGRPPANVGQVRRWLRTYLMAGLLFKVDTPGNRAALWCITQRGRAEAERIATMEAEL